MGSKPTAQTLALDSQVEGLSNQISGIAAMNHSSYLTAQRIHHATGRFWAGQTSVAPSSADPTASGNPSGYDPAQTGILWAGELWPYQVPTRQLANNGATGWYPGFYENTELNGYRDGVFIPADTFVNGASLRMELAGDWVIPAAGKVWMMEVILEPNIDPASPSACGASNDKAIGFQFRGINDAVNNGTFPFRLVLEGTSLGRSIAGTSFTQGWVGNLIVGADKTGQSAPILDAKRTAYRTYSESTFNWRTTDALLNFRYKIEIDGTAFQVDGVGSQGVGCFVRANSFTCDLFKGRP